MYGGGTRWPMKVEHKVYSDTADQMDVWVYVEKKE